MTDKPSPMDWVSMRARVAQANLDAHHRSGGMSDDDAQRILHERATMLARTSDVATTSAGPEVLVFVLSDERYAIDISYVLETVRSVGPTLVPGIPSWFVGIESVRGEMIAVVDLDRLLDAPERPMHARKGPGHLIVLGQTSPEFAVRCDELLTVTVLPKAGMRAVPRVPGADERRHIVGVMEDSVLVLDAEALLADERLVVEQVEES